MNSKKICRIQVFLKMKELYSFVQECAKVHSMKHKEHVQCVK